MCLGPQAREARWRLGVWGFGGVWSHRYVAPEGEPVTAIEAIVGTNNPEKLMQRVPGPLVYETTRSISSTGNNSRAKVKVSYASRPGEDM